MEKEKSLLRVNEFAELLDVTPAAVRRWLLERKISSIRIGRLVRIPREVATEIIDRGFRPARGR
jgi:excisionase family DNA binding protein